MGERVEARFDQLDMKVSAMQAQLDRIEHALVRPLTEVVEPARMRPSSITTQDSVDGERFGHDMCEVGGGLLFSWILLRW